MDDGSAAVDSNENDGRVAERPTEKARWMAAASYLAFMSLVSLRQPGKDLFIRYHASQGFLLFMAECAGLATLLLLSVTVGRMKIIGLVIVGMFALVVGVGAIMLSAIGFVKALFGEYWCMPFLGQYRDRVPGLHARET